MKYTDPDDIRFWVSLGEGILYRTQERLEQLDRGWPEHFIGEEEVCQEVLQIAVTQVSDDRSRYWKQQRIEQEQAVYNTALVTGLGLDNLRALMGLPHAEKGEIP